MSLNRSVPFRGEARAARRVAAGAAALVLALALAGPVHAAPIGQDGGLFVTILMKVQRWLDGLPGPPPTPPAGGGPIPAPLPESCEMDPNGSTCESTEATSPDAPVVEDPSGTSPG